MPLIGGSRDGIYPLDATARFHRACAAPWAAWSAAGGPSSAARCNPTRPWC